MARIHTASFYLFLIFPLAVGCSTTKPDILADKDENPSGVEEEIVLSSRKHEDPTSKMYTDFGYFFLQIGNQQKAIEHFRTAAKIDKRDPQPYIGLAKIYMQMQHPDKALEILEHGSKYCKKSPELWNEIGVVQSARKDMAAAVNAMEKALKLSPESPLYIENYAAMLAVKGDYDQSYEAYSKLFPPFEARYRIAGIAFSQGKSDDSKLQLELALQANPNHEPSIAMMSRFTNEGIIQAGYVGESSTRELESSSGERNEASRR